MNKLMAEAAPPNAGAAKLDWITIDQRAVCAALTAWLSGIVGIDGAYEALAVAPQPAPDCGFNVLLRRDDAAIAAAHGGRPLPAPAELARARAALAGGLGR